MGSLLREVLGVIQNFLRYSSKCVLTSASSTGDILYYLLAASIESGSKSVLCIMDLSGGIPGFSNILLN